MKESVIQKQIMEYLKALNVPHWRSPNITIHRRKNIVKRGVSDIIGCYKGKLLAIECKKPGGVQSQEQKDFHEEITREGGISILAYSVDDVIKALSP